MEIAPKNTLESLDNLIEILRGEKGCPWDKKQTPKSIAVCLTEETKELADAIDSNNPSSIKEELGDVLFQIIFIARMFKEKNEFSISDVIEAINEKMIRRHPHVFGDSKVDSVEQVLQQWDRIKQSEKENLLQKKDVSQKNDTAFL